MLPGPQCRASESKISVHVLCPARNIPQMKANALWQVLYTSRQPRLRSCKCSASIRCAAHKISVHVTQVSHFTYCEACLLSRVVQVACRAIVYHQIQVMRKKMLCRHSSRRQGARIRPQPGRDLLQAQQHETSGNMSRAPGGP